MANYILRHFDREENETVLFKGKGKKAAYEATLKAIETLRPVKSSLQLYDGKYFLWQMDYGLDALKRVFFKVTTPHVKKTISIDPKLYQDFTELKKQYGMTTDQFFESALFSVSILKERSKAMQTPAKPRLPWEEEKELYEDPTDR